MARTFITANGHSSRNSADIYRESFVTFIDILGFSNIIEQSKFDPTITKGLYKALSEAPTSSPLIGPPNYPPGMTYGDFTSTNFSDSIVISTDKNIQGLMTALETGRAFASILLQFGLLTRGGVASGQLIHDENVIFGPGIVNSYIIESREAKFARIILSDECADLANKEVSSQGSASEYFSKTLKTDEDGRIFIHILREMEETRSRDINDDVSKWWWGRVKQTVTDYLVQSEGMPYRNKVEWFAKYYNNCLGAEMCVDDTDWRAPIDF